MSNTRSPADASPGTSAATRRIASLRWRCPIAKPGCYVVELRDQWDRLLALFAADDPDAFEWVEAQMAARLARAAQPRSIGRS